MDFCPSFLGIKNHAIALLLKGCLALLDSARTSSPAGTRLCRPDAFPTLVPPVGSLRIRSSASVPRRAPLDSFPSYLLRRWGTPEFEMSHLSKARANSEPPLPNSEYRVVAPASPSALKVRAKSQRPSQCSFLPLGPSTFSIALQVPSPSSHPPNTRSSCWIPRRESGAWLKFRSLRKSLIAICSRSECGAARGR